MSERADLASLDQASRAAVRYGFTFGTHSQTTSWTDRRRLAWPDLANLLTAHVVGQKEGTCIVPAVFRGTERKKRDAVQIDVAFLDSDAGSTLHEICAAIRARGWSAIVSSTHSHLATRTRAKRSNWDKFLGGAAARPDSASTFLERERGYLPRIARDARLVSADPEYALFEHQPCPKFRIAIPLERPWLANSYGNQRAADAAWKGCVEALAAMHAPPRPPSAWMAGARDAGSGCAMPPPSPGRPRACRPAAIRRQRLRRRRRRARPRRSRGTRCGPRPGCAVTVRGCSTTAPGGSPGRGGGDGLEVQSNEARTRRRLASRARGGGDQTPTGVVQSKRPPSTALRRVALIG